VRDTIKKECANTAGVASAPTKRYIDVTIPRKGLWQAQTPQVFARSLILECFEKRAREAADIEVTDDASVCEYCQIPVALVESSMTNFKVTEPSDLPIAEAYLNQGLVH